MKKQILLKDFLDYRFLSDVHYNSDGTKAAYVVSVPREEHNDYQRNIYIKDHTGNRILTGMGKESMYIWEDSNTLLFAALRDEDDKEAVKNGEERTVFYRISLHGGEAQKAFTIPLTVTQIWKIKDGVFAFTAAYHLQYSHMYQLDEEAKAAVIKAKKEMGDYEVLDELPFYGNGAGYTNKIRNSLFVYEEENDHITRISEKTCDVSCVEIDPAGAYIIYAGISFQAKRDEKEGIYSYHIEQEENRVLLEQGKYMIYDLQIWGKHLLVIASDMAKYGMSENPKFYMLDYDKHDLVLFADNEEGLGSSVGSDCRYGGGNYKKLYQDEFYFITTRYNASHVYVLHQDGTMEAIFENEGSVDCIDVFENTLLFVGMQNGKLQELYAYDLQKKICTQVSSFNEEVYQTKDIRPLIPCNIQQGDMTLYGWVMTPRDYDASKSYPAILDIHGGPKTVYGEVYYHEMQVWANMGYFVFFMNPRGGDGRGNEFADLRGKYGTIDYDDLMKFCDQVLRGYPIDPSRVGVTGGSYGGFMTNWIIGHTDRFKAAASQRSIANWIGFGCTSDIGEMFASDQQAADAWSNPEKLWWHSPLKYADRCKTPTLFIHSNEDYRCPYSEGLQMYSALCAHGVETRLVMFKGENHELSRSGKPKHRVKRLEEITAWMEKYLKKNK